MLDAPEDGDFGTGGRNEVRVATRLGDVVLPLGGRVVVRYLLPDGTPNDALGVLESVDERALVVRPDRVPGCDPVVVDATRVVVAKIVPPRSRRRVRDVPPGV